MKKSAYVLTTPILSKPLGMTYAEAVAAAELVRNDRSGRMGRGRLKRVEVYQQRTPGNLWSVAVVFQGAMYECGRVRRRLEEKAYVYHLFNFAHCSDGIEDCDHTPMDPNCGCDTCADRRAIK